MGNYKEKILPRVYEDYKEMLEEDTEDGLPSNVGNFFSSLGTSFATLGICEYLINQDITDMKNYLYNAVVAAERTLKIYDAKKNNKITIGLSMMNFQSLYYGIISEHMESIFSFATLMGGRKEAEDGATTIHVINLGYTLKYITLDDYTKAGFYLEKIKGRALEKYNYGLIEILEGIINGNTQLVEEGLKKRLKYHSRSNQFLDCPEQFLSIEVIALAKLAGMKGLKVTLNDELAPMEIIEQGDVPYQLAKIMTCPY